MISLFFHKFNWGYSHRLGSNPTMDKIGTGLLVAETIITIGLLVSGILGALSVLPLPVLVSGLFIGMGSLSALFLMEAIFFIQCYGSMTSQHEPPFAR